MTLRLSPALCFALIVVLAGGCSKSNPPHKSAESSGNGGAISIDAANTGAVSGTIRFAGTAPARVPIDMDQDPARAVSSTESNLSEGIIVNQGTLQNVLISVKQGRQDYAMST